MASFATLQSGNYVRPLRSTARIEHFRVDLSQTVRIGDLMVLGTDSDEGNRIKKSGADPTADRGIVGFAAEALTTDATGATTDVIPVWIADERAEFIAHVCGAAFADETLDNDDVSVQFGLLEDTTAHVWRVDTSETSAKIASIVRNYDAAGDTNGRVVFRVLASERLYI